MAKPFTFTPVDPATRPDGWKPAKMLKPGWHKRAVAADRAAERRRVYTAARPESAEANAKARQYAAWLAARDGIDLSGLGRGGVEWMPCAAGMRPRAVTFEPNVGGGLSVLLPHWSYVAPEVIETHAAPWVAPVAAEISGEARAAIVAAMTDHDAALWVDAVSEAYAMPGEWHVGSTDEPEAEPVPVSPAPMPLCPAVGEPCRMDCSHRAGCTPRPAPVVGIADAWGPSPQSHPVTALCLSDAARAALLYRVMDGTGPAPDRSARGGAWRVTLADALDLQDIPSVRWVGMPRKPRAPRHALLPVEAIHPVAPVEAIVPAFMTGAGRAPVAVTLHAAP